MYTAEHPDTHADYARLKQLTRGGKQALEDQAIAAYMKAIDEGKSKEEIEKIYFSFFNNKL